MILNVAPCDTNIAPPDSVALFFEKVHDVIVNLAFVIAWMTPPSFDLFYIKSEKDIDTKVLC